MWMLNYKKPAEYFIRSSNGIMTEIVQHTVMRLRHHIHLVYTWAHGTS